MLDTRDQDAAEAVMSMVSAFTNQFHASEAEVLRHVAILAASEAHRLSCMDPMRNR